MPIHRGRPTKNYTNIDNRVFRDQRLAGEDRALLLQLLSHHPGWKVIVPYVMQEMKWGRDKTYKILNRLELLGYIHREQPRDSNGNYGEIVYDVFDDPANNPHFLTQSPLPDLPRTEIPKAYKERSTKRKESPLPPKQSSSDATSFEAFWTAYETSSYMSKFATGRLWSTMSEADRQSAISALNAYSRDCKARNRNPHNILRYLRERIYEGYATAPTRTAWSHRPYSPQWWAWHRYKLEHQQDVSFMESRARAGHGFTTKDELPPDK